ncbi:leucine-rich repeat-containing protein 20 [Folsomia candida]|uniref:Leucine-rich repeat-containing protein 20 n=1 Tax=Folsomia candida TaxID=158441 RepID=A0A226EHM5_FOLCA|nr:leucine-rich repeat-containing protein 20 [Folsomia candida]XP_021947909.1 leucine-rich repeat-containing protein 20 [Folsomia candida]OXA57193.1 Leucine-rich repeat-containing protein 20 [Folsomia candida]
MRPHLTDLTNNGGSAEESEDGSTTTPAAYHQAMMCTRQAGKAIIRVVGRCNDAKENENLDLSDCQLMQVPDAIFLLMRNTNLKTCDLSSNVITKIPPQLGHKFSCIRKLNLSHNRMSKLPEELRNLGQLSILNISHNAFLNVPRIVYELPKLEQLNAEKNYIADVDTDRLRRRVSIKLVNLKENPLSKEAEGQLATISNITIHFSPRVMEEWEQTGDGY